jgi:hypothetical protein
MRCQQRVVIGVAAWLRVCMHERGGQPRQSMQKIVLGVHRDLMRGIAVAPASTITSHSARS